MELIERNSIFVLIVSGMMTKFNFLLQGFAREQHHRAVRVGLSGSGKAANSVSLQR
jgi:hypothetical protein